MPLKALWNQPDQAAESIRGFVHPSEDYEEAVNLLRGGDMGIEPL